MKIVTRILLIVAFFALSVQANGLSKEAVIDKMIEVYGGEAILTQVSSYDQVWAIDRKVGSKEGVDYRQVTLPDYLNTQLVYDDKSETRTLLKDKGVKITNGTKVEPKGPMLDAMKLQLMRLYSPIVLKNKIKDITLSSTDTQYELSLPKGTILTTYFVSKKSFLIEKVIGKLTMGDQSMEFKTLYQNYREVNGLMLANTEVKYAAEINTAIMTLKDMRLPPKKSTETTETNTTTK